MDGAPNNPRNRCRVRSLGVDWKLKAGRPATDMLSWTASSLSIQ